MQRLHVISKITNKQYILSILVWRISILEVAKSLHVVLNHYKLWLIIYCSVFQLTCTLVRHDRFINGTVCFQKLAAVINREWLSFSTAVYIRDLIPYYTMPFPLAIFPSKKIDSSPPEKDDCKVDPPPLKAVVMKNKYRRSP